MFTRWSRIFFVFLSVVALAGAALVSGCPCPRPPKRPAPVLPCLKGQTSSGLPKCLQLKMVGAREGKAGNIQVLFQAMDCAGKPYPGLDIKRPGQTFVVEEGDRKVSAYESQVTILPRQVAARMYSLLLLDVSESVRKSKSLKALRKRALEIVRGTVANHQLAIAVFDGRPGIQMLQTFTTDAEKLKTAIESLKDWKVKDPSTNLYGAYIAGLDLVSDRQRKARDNLVRGSLILITDGSDQAGRRTRGEAVKAGKKFLEETGLIYTIGVGGEIDNDVIKALGMTRHYVYGNWAKFNAGAIGSLLDAMNRLGRSYYVLSYCSPKRAGNHAVRVRLKAYPKAVVKYDFDASEFTGKCDAKAVLKDCKYIQCGGPEDSKCNKCPEGYTCEEHRCLSEKHLTAEKSRMRSVLAARAEQKRKQAAAYGACMKVRKDRLALWEQYSQEMQKYRAKGCGRR